MRRHHADSGPLGQAVSPVSLTISYATTDDLPSGQPWMPDGRDFWSVVSRANGTTKWRRLSLKNGA